MKSLLKFASAAIGLAAFGFLLSKSDQSTHEPVAVAPDKAVGHQGGAPINGPYQAPPVKSAAAPGSHAGFISSGTPATHASAVAGPDIPAVEASVDSIRGSSSATLPASSPQHFSPAAAGPAVVDQPMGWEPPVREISIPVPEGEMVPAVFQDDTPKPPAQRKALDRIATEFEQNVSEIPPGMTQSEVWGLAREIADERYLTLFGYEAYNQYHLRGAREALREKRGVQASAAAGTSP
jgi:hypothetical protein